MNKTILFKLSILTLAMIFSSSSASAFKASLGLGFGATFNFKATLGLENRDALIDEKSYKYPHQDPYIATLASALAGFETGLEELPCFQSCIEKFPERKKTRFFGETFFEEARHTACFKLFYQRRTKAPVVFVLNGIGAPPSSGISNFLTAKLYQQGYHVIQIASQLHWRSNLGLIANGRPGAVKYDSKDMYEFMKETVKSTSGWLKVSDFALAGYSLGALQALFIAHHDSEEGYFNFKKVALLNPPVRLERSASRLDLLYKEYDQLSEQQKYNIRTLPLKAYFDSEKKREPLKHASDILSALPVSKAKQIIGQIFRESLAESLMITELTQNLGFFDVNKRQVEGILKQTRKWSYGDYLEKIVLPYYIAREGKTKSQVLYENSMVSLESFIKKSPHIFIHHTKDDIILVDGDIEFIKKTFGQRATIFPSGGHLGNIWFKPNADLLMRQMSFSK